MRFNIANVTRVLALLFLICSSAWAAEVSVVALFPGKAMLVIDKEKPRTLGAGETYAGVTLISADSEEAVVSIAGKQLGRDDERDLFPQALRLVEEGHVRGKVVIEVTR